jgi:predicted Zn-dependent protease
MRNLYIQGFVIVLLFFATWFVLTEINWISILKVEQVSKKTEEKLGDLFWELFNKTEKEIKNENVILPFDTILSRICDSNGIDKSKIKIHIVRSDEINAFALPDNHLIIYSGLISASENEEEISGVICHEIAHMKMNHVMKKLIKEAGLSAIISISTGNSGSEIIKETAKLLSSSAYDRKLEKEADLKAVEYLIKSNISPEPFANLLSRLGDTQTQIESRLAWISTHPDSKERAEYILEKSGNTKRNYQPVLMIGTWEKLQGDLNN